MYRVSKQPEEITSKKALIQRDPLSDPYITEACRAVRAANPTRLDLGYHGHPLRKIARSILACEDMTEVDLAWLLRDLVRADIPDSDGNEGVIYEERFGEDMPDADAAYDDNPQ